MKILFYDTKNYDRESFQSALGAFPDIAMILPAGESRQEIYHTAAYGELPSGCYRIAVKGLTAEFVIQASCIPEGDA